MRGELKSFVTAIVVGLVFAGLYAASRPAQARPIMIMGVVVGICVWAAIRLMELAVDRRLESLQPKTRAAAKAVIFLIGGLSGWLVGVLISSAFFGFGVSARDALSGTGRIFMLITGGAVVIVGMSMYGYELLERRLGRTIEKLKEHEWAEKELELARAIQSRLLPPPFVEGTGFAIAARNLPARYVAGDFYDILRLDDGTIVIVVADVAGKGVGASLIMASVKAVLPFVAREGAQRAMSMLNEKLVSELGKREFVALAYVRFHPAGGSIELLNAGFPDPYIVSAAGVRALTALGERLPLGLRRDAVYEPLLATLAQGERLVLLSDGIPEAPANGEPLGYERVASILGAMKGEARGEAWLDAFLGDVRSAVDAGLDDDWTAVVLERTQT